MQVSQPIVSLFQSGGGTFAPPLVGATWFTSKNGGETANRLPSTTRFTSENVNLCVCQKDAQSREQRGGPSVHPKLEFGHSSLWHLLNSLLDRSFRHRLQARALELLRHKRTRRPDSLPSTR